MRSPLFGLAIAVVVIATALGVLVPRARREEVSRDLTAQVDRCEAEQDARGGAMQDDLYGLRRRLELACDAASGGALLGQEPVAPNVPLLDDDRDFLFIVSLDGEGEAAPRVLASEPDYERRYAPDAAHLAALARAFPHLAAGGIPRDEPLRRALWIADAGEHGAHARVVSCVSSRYTDRPRWAIVAGRVYSSASDIAWSFHGGPGYVYLEPELRDASGAPAERAWLLRRDCWIPVPSTSPSNLELGIIAGGAVLALALGALAARRRIAT